MTYKHDFYRKNGVQLTTKTDIFRLITFLSDLKNEQSFLMINSDISQLSE